MNAIYTYAYIKNGNTLTFSTPSASAMKVWLEQNDIELSATEINKLKITTSAAVGSYEYHTAVQNSINIFLERARFDFTNESSKDHYPLVISARTQKMELPPQAEVTRERSNAVSFLPPIPQSQNETKHGKNLKRDRAEALTRERPIRHQTFIPNDPEMLAARDAAVAAIESYDEKSSSDDNPPDEHRKKVTRDKPVRRAAFIPNDPAMLVARANAVAYASDSDIESEPQQSNNKNQQRRQGIKYSPIAAPVTTLPKKATSPMMKHDILNEITFGEQEHETQKPHASENNSSTVGCFPCRSKNNDTTKDDSSVGSKQTRSTAKSSLSWASLFNKDAKISMEEGQHAPGSAVGLQQASVPAPRRTRIPTTGKF